MAQQNKSETYRIEHFIIECAECSLLNMFNVNTAAAHIAHNVHIDPPNPFQQDTRNDPSNKILYLIWMFYTFIIYKLNGYG